MEGSSIFRAYKVLMQMLRDRNFVISDRDLSISLAEFEAKLENNENPENQYSRLNMRYGKKDSAIENDEDKRS